MIPYSQIIKFNRLIDIVFATRISKCMDYVTYKQVDFTQLYRGHAQWVADQINQQTNYRKR